MQKFRDSDLKDYFYDASSDTVYSRKSGEPRALKWSQQYKWSPKRVSVMYGYRKASFTRQQILTMLQPATNPVKENVAQHVVQTNDLSMVKPAHDFVVFSKPNRCSQYFFANTSLQEALDRFARRGEIVNPADVRVLNVATGKVSELAVKTMQVYTLD